MTESKIVNLHGTPLQPQIVNTAVIEFLEEMLESAKAGRCQFVAFVGGDDAFVVREFKGIGSKAMVLGQIDMLHLAVLTAEEHIP